MMNERSIFEKISPTDTMVGVANDGIMKAKGIGTVKIKVKDTEGAVTEMSIHEVLYVPECSQNLLSEGLLDERGIKVITENGKKFFKEGKLVATAIRHGRLYYLDTVEDWASEHAFRTESSSRTGIAKLWHRRLGHIGHGTAKELATW